MNDTSITIADLIGAGADRLQVSSDSPRLDAELLLCEALGVGREHLYAWPETEVAAAQQAVFDALLVRRVGGEPIAYITGWRGFWSLDLAITADVLVPRPETERLVELALARVAADEPARIADLCTGSGAVALALAVERPRCHVVATELSVAAAAVARHNAARLDIGNVEVREGDLFEPLHDERFDLIVANPPYVASGDEHLTRGDVAHEPRLALDGGADGLDVIRRITAAAPAHLQAGASLLLEHGSDQGARVRSLLHGAGLQAVETYRDYGGHERVTCAAAPA